MLDVLNDFMTKFGQVAVVFSVAFALLQCFLGYRLLKVWVTVIGFLVGFALGFGISSVLIKGEAYLPAVIGLVAGFIAFAAVRTIPLPDEQVWNIVLMVLAVAAFVVAGILAVKFSRPCIIAITAVSGAFNAVHSLKTPIPVLGSNYALGLVVTLVIAALGIAVQFATTKEVSRRRR